MVSLLGGAGGGAVVSIIIKAIDNYSKEFKKLDKGLKKQETGFKKLGTMLSKVGIGYMVIAGAAAAFGVQSVKTAIQSERAFQQFNLALGDSADMMLKDMKRASKGMVSDFELVENANRALALGISKNQIAPLLEVATARAKVFGRTTSEAFSDMSIGIGRQSRMILDNLGIILDLDTVYADYADTMGIVGRQLTNTEQKMAITNAILEESQGLVQAQIFLEETHDEKLQRLGASWTNLKQKVGLYLLTIADSFDQSVIAEEQRKQEIDTMTGMEGTYDEVSEAVIELTKRESDLTEELETSNIAAEQLIDSLLNLKDITFEGERSGTLEIAQQKEAIRQLELKELRGEDVTDQLDKEKDKLQELRLMQEEYDNTREIQQAQNAIDLENLDELQSVSFEDFALKEEQKFADLDTERDKQDAIRLKIIDVKAATKNLTDVFTIGQKQKEEGYDMEKESIDELISRTDVLIQKYKDAADAKSKVGTSEKKSGFFSTYTTAGGGSSRQVGDAILRPNGEVIETDPKDTLIATKNPGGMGGITFYIENINGIDADEISRALSREFSTKVSL